MDNSGRHQTHLQETLVRLQSLLVKHTLIMLIAMILSLTSMAGVLARTLPHRSGRDPAYSSTGFN